MNISFIKEYGKFLRRYIKVKKPVTIIFDCSNGYVGHILKEALKGVKNIKAFYLNDIPDGNFPGHGPDPTVNGALDTLIKEVLIRRADLGVAFDGDGDRVIFIDDKGREINADAVAKLYIFFKKPKKVVFDIRISRYIKIPKVKIVRTMVGHYHIKKEMLKNKISFGAETTGHYYFHFKGAYVDLAVMMAFIFISIVSRKNSISKWIDDNQSAFRVKEMNFLIKDKDIILNKIKKFYTKRNPKWSEIDGLTAEFKDFWFNIRASSTEDFIRLNIEAKTELVLQKELNVIKSLIQQ